MNNLQNYDNFMLAVVPGLSSDTTISVSAVDSAENTKELVSTERSGCNAVIERSIARPARMVRRNFTDNLVNKRSTSSASFDYATCNLSFSFFSFELRSCCLDHFKIRYHCFLVFPRSRLKRQSQRVSFASWSQHVSSSDFRGTSCFVCL